MLRFVRPLVLGDLVAVHGGSLDAEVDPARSLATIAASDDDGACDIAPVLHERGAVRLSVLAGVYLVAESCAGRVTPGHRWVHPSPEVVLLALLDRVVEPAPPVVPPDAVLEPNVVLFPGVVLGRGVRIGAGSVVGRPGFHYIGDRQLPHPAGVVLGDGVELGACCTVDAGILQPTTLGARTKLDAQVHVGHGVRVGADCRLAAQVGLAGSVVVEDEVWIGGQAGVADHCHLGRGARIAAKAGVIGDVPEGAVFAGYPAVARQRWLRGHARLYRK